MKMINYTKYINYFLIAYALCLPISKAGVNLFESLIFLFWILEANWKYKFSLIKNNLLSISILALIILSILSLPHAKSFSFGISYILKYRHFLIILVILSSLEKKYVQYIFSAFLTGIFISEIVSYGIFFEIWSYKNILPSDPSPFMSHTDYSIYLAFATVLLLNRILKNRFPLKNIFFYIFFFITATANLFMNGGRTGQIAFIVLIFLNILLNLKNKLKAILIFSILISTILLTAYNISPIFKQKVIYTQNEVTNMVQHQDYSGGFAQRVALWRIGLENFKENFLLGTGIGNDMNNLKEYSDKFNYDYDYMQYFEKGDNHNTVITISLQLGIFGLLIMITIFYSIASLKFKDNYYKILNISFFTVFFLWSMGGITFHTIQAMIFFALFGGLFNKISYLEK
jgi:O-antigen ligase